MTALWFWPSLPLFRSTSSCWDEKQLGLGWGPAAAMCSALQAAVPRPRRQHSAVSLRVAAGPHLSCTSSGLQYQQQQPTACLRLHVALQTTLAAQCSQPSKQPSAQGTTTSQVAAEAQSSCPVTLTQPWPVQEALQTDGWYACRLTSVRKGTTDLSAFVLMHSSMRPSRPRMCASSMAWFARGSCMDLQPETAMHGLQVQHQR